MSIAITPKTTVVSDKSSNLFQVLTSVSGTNGNWLIATFSGDTNNIFNVKIVSGGVDGINSNLIFTRIASVLNSGNVATSVFIARIAESFSNKTWNGSMTSSLALAGTLYEVSSLGSIPVAMGSYSVAGTTFVTNGTSKFGQYIYQLTPCTISSVTARLHKTGSPTGTLYIRVRKGNNFNGELLETIGSIDVSTLATSATDYTFNTTSFVNTITRDCTIFIEPPAGASNLITITPFNNNLDASCIGVASSNDVIQLSAFGGENQASYSLFKSVVGGYHINPVDKIASATGTGTSPSSGATSTLSDSEELVIGAIGTEDSGDVGDLKGVWTTGTGNVSGNEQAVGTTGGGDASNVNIYSAAEAVNITNAQTATVTGTDNIDWAALIVTFKTSKSLIYTPPQLRNYIRM
jgi:hypothetical protein